MHLESRLLHWKCAGTEIALAATAARPMQQIHQ